MVNSLGLTGKNTKYKEPRGTIFRFCSEKLGDLFVLFCLFVRLFFNLVTSELILKSWVVLIFLTDGSHNPVLFIQQTLTECLS